MFKISCFADELSPDLNEQIEFLRRNNIKYIEFRGVWNKNVLDLSDNELTVVKERLDQYGIKVSSIGSPIGKVGIEEDFKNHLARFERAVEIAKFMDSKYIRIFSFYMKKEQFDIYEDIVIDRMRCMMDIASQDNVVLLHENDAGLYGETSDRCLKILESINNTNLRAVFDPCNFAIAGEDTLCESLFKLKKFIRYIHIKDFSISTKQIVMAGRGDANIKEILYALKDRQEMFISLEPHLDYAGESRGFTGSVLFQQDFDELINILSDIGAEYI